jgi:hypothetical protein
MTPILRTAIRSALTRLIDVGSLNAKLAQVSASDGSVGEQIDEKQVLWQSLSIELAEKIPGTHYPVLLVHCERVKNTLKQKFSRFSGTASIAVEARVSSDRAEGLEDQTQTYVDAIVSLLEDSKGNWGDGIYYPGCYEVAYGALRPGGKRFLKTARVSFDLEVHTN